MGNSPTTLTKTLDITTLSNTTFHFEFDYFSIFLMVITGNKPLKISIFKNDTS